MKIKRKPGFQKGDPRINRKGRPPGFDALRELAKAIAQEKVQGDAEKRTLQEIVLRSWALSGAFDKQKAFLEIAYGKIPDAVEHGGDVTIRIVRDRSDA